MIIGTAHKELKISFSVKLYVSYKYQIPIELRKKKWDDYILVTFDHFWRRSLSLSLSLKANCQIKLSLSKSLIHSVHPVIKYWYYFGPTDKVGKKSSKKLNWIKKLWNNAKNFFILHIFPSLPSVILFFVIIKFSSQHRALP